MANVHHATCKAADISLAKKQISPASHRAVLAGEINLERARELGRDRGPDDTGQASDGPGRSSSGPRSASADTGAERAPCLCGCGQRPKSHRSLFVQGHDARLHGELKRNLEKDPLLRNERFTNEQRRYAVERGLAGPEVLPENHGV